MKSGVRKDWMTGEAYYGKLENGLSGTCSLHLARKLLNNECKSCFDIKGWFGRYRL